MFKKYITLPALLLLGTIAMGQSNDVQCTEFHTGTFKYNDGSNANIVITRTATHQTETNTLDQSFKKYKIEWISDCEYQLTLEESSDERLSVLIGKSKKEMILKAEGYAYENLSDLEGKGASNKLVKVH